MPPGRIHTEIELTDTMRADPAQVAANSERIAAEMAGMHV
jgi:hypothetical protein